MALLAEKWSFDTSDYLDYHYGVNDKDFAMKFITTPDGPVILTSDQITNPLFVGEDGGNLSKLDSKEIYSNFSRVLVVCMRDNFVDQPELYENSYGLVINKNQSLKLSVNYAFLKTNMNLLNEKYYKRCANVVQRDLLVNLYGLNGSILENEEIVVPMFELVESMARMNLSLYDVQFDLTDAKTILSLTKFYNKDNRRLIIDRLSEKLGHLQESQFWSNPRNCNINMSRHFQTRGFVTQKDIKKAANDKLLKKITQKSVDTDYGSFDDSKCDPYVDLHTVLKTSKNRTYYIDNVTTLNFSKEDITELFMELESEKEMYNLFNSLAVSKEYCHTVVNNKDILIKMKPLFSKYAPVYKLIFGYAWLSFVLEEYIMKSKSTIDDRFVFDLDTAHHLPTFPFVFDDLHQNPYIVAPIALNKLSAQQNAMSLFCIDGFEGYGVCDQQTFTRRINLLTSGNADQNILKGLDWKSFAISGSSVTACIQKKSPLFLNIETQNATTDENTSKFFHNYYNVSDIDLMCNEQSIFGFTEKTAIAIEQIKSNIKEFKDGDLHVTPIKSLYICISRQFFVINCDAINETLGTSYTVDELMKNCENSEFKEYLYPIYVTHKQKANSAIRKSGKVFNEYMQQFMNYSSAQDIKIDILNETLYEHTFDSDISLRVNDFKSADNKVTESENQLLIKICEGIKFKIGSKKMVKEIELFRCKTNDFFGVVGKFHLPCVRAYSNGYRVAILPTDITAMMTGVNLDYRYFVGVKNQFAILYKYMARGFGTLLSSRELLDMRTYASAMTDSELYSVKSLDDANKLFGGKELTDPIYKPLEIKNGLTGIYSSPTVKYIKTIEDLREYYKKNCNYVANDFGLDMMKFTTYSSDGDVVPFNTLIPKLYYDLANRKKSNQNYYK